jgi:two-component system cell cycle sensor histidine kinase/response regulator CckA
MVIDDDPSLLGFTCKYLSKLGYAVTPYRSSQEAWKHFELPDADYSLVVVDLSMPVISGEQLSRMMLNSNPGIRLILTSGHPFDPETLLEAGPSQVAFLHKPFSPAMLAGTVDRLIRGGAEDDAD